jgi:hypothetical protein
VTKTYALVSFPSPKVTGPACQTCEGLGVTSEQYQMQTDPDRPVLLVDVFCPDCDGCGSADPEHRSCDPAAHASLEPEDYLDEDDEDDEDDDERCPSCQGRQWVAVQGFGGTDTGNDEDVTKCYLRVPCGCTAERTQLIER